MWLTFSFEFVAKKFTFTGNHVRIQRGEIGVLDPLPWKITSYMGFYKNKHLDPRPPGKSWTPPGKCWTL